MRTSAFLGILLGLLNLSATAADLIRPTVSITSPAANARVTNETVRVSGRATDNVAVDGVDVFVDGQFAQTVTPATNRIWFADLALTPGAHQIAAEAVDTSANHSVRAKVNVTRVVLAPLTLNIEQGGRVIGAADGQNLEIGKRYTITALAQTGYIFAGWGGAVTSAAPSISFTMGTNTVLQAKFRATTFTGLFFPHMYDFANQPWTTNIFGNVDDITPDNSGYFQITRTANGYASGKIVMRGRTVTFSRVQIRSDDTADFDFIAFGTRLYVSFDIVKEEGLETLRGAIDDGHFVADLAADSVAQSKNPLVGKYNFEMVPGAQQDFDPVTEPPGGSIGGVRITGSSAALTGILADGTVVSSSSQISAAVLSGQYEGEVYLPVYIPLQAGRGMVIGWMNLDTHTNLVPAIVGPQIHWYKAPSSRDHWYPNGFSISRETAGYRYTIPPLNQNALGWTNGTLFLDYGNLQVVGSPGTPEIQKSVVATRAKIVVNDDPTAPIGTTSVQDLRITLTMNPADGSVTGIFRHPVSGANTRINAIVLQRPATIDHPNDAPYISGYFLGTDQGGDVVIVKD